MGEETMKRGEKLPRFLELEGEAAGEEEEAAGAPWLDGEI